MLAVLPIAAAAAAAGFERTAGFEANWENGLSCVQTLVAVVAVVVLAD